MQFSLRADAAFPALAVALAVAIDPLALAVAAVAPRHMMNDREQAYVRTSMKRNISFADPNAPFPHKQLPATKRDEKHECTFLQPRR